MVWRPDCEVSVELANESMRLSVMLLHLELVQPPAKADEPADGPAHILDPEQQPSPSGTAGSHPVERRPGPKGSDRQTVAILCPPPFTRRSVGVACRDAGDGDRSSPDETSGSSIFIPQ